MEGGQVKEGGMGEERKEGGGGRKRRSPHKRDFNERMMEDIISLLIVRREAPVRRDGWLRGLVLLFGVCVGGECWGGGVPTCR